MKGNELRRTALSAVKGCWLAPLLLCDGGVLLYCGVRAFFYMDRERDLWIGKPVVLFLLLWLAAFLSLTAGALCEQRWTGHQVIGAVPIGRMVTMSLVLMVPDLLWVIPDESYFYGPVPPCFLLAFFVFRPLLLPCRFCLFRSPDQGVLQAVREGFSLGRRHWGQILIWELQLWWPLMVLYLALFLLSRFTAPGLWLGVEAVILLDRFSPALFTALVRPYIYMGETLWFHSREAAT